ncbi:4-hydroxy-tetrahydrodipicolinate synthase [Enterococcus xiangfangensis]|uniref:4-hydroxy-tetrahydrodipicolinate synthase n=1 Tax=Enterococcus xiangfangensis TaxID=1296537 RepID=A0ABU3F8N4_9ENTE|nr:4-hydroxy-tetrahydrodipicolinate synthase [Enterococcus xiangfangensis]MBM7710920.1 4-hydroxy-tetrahydrodipicolinate synthase [Enterococcus xiangfangensis]MDT2759019.1 4-hydroxy-tetrahydrodipicolinate synthase [Enterococcus xiangfangensis]NBK07879.1 4-hydroxy-tetrahydrodipicolinate synthase [Enterococcus asini]
MKIFEGSGVALVTPMKADGVVDYKQLGELVEWQIAEGTDAIIACGTTGEASTLANDEHIAVIEAVVKKVNGRIPVIAGTGVNDTRHAIELSTGAEKVGADALLIVTPYYNKTSDDGLFLHYQKIAQSVKLPIILYSVASRTNMNITPQMVTRLSEIPNIVAIKEASGDISQIAEIARITPDDFAIYSGNDDQVLPIMALGGSGSISTIANIAPHQTHELTHALLDGDLQLAQKIQLAQLPLIHTIFSEVNPIPVKTAVSLLGKIEPNFRLPLTAAKAETVERLKNEMTAYGLEVAK